MVEHAGLDRVADRRVADRAVLDAATLAGDQQLRVARVAAAQLVQSVLILPQKHLSRHDAALIMPLPETSIFQLNGKSC